MCRSKTVGLSKLGEIGSIKIFDFMKNDELGNDMNQQWRLRWLSVVCGDGWFFGYGVEDRV